MEIDDLQGLVDQWIRDHGGYWGKFEILARLTEELGEVASALQREQGLRPRRSDVDLEAEVGDLFFTLMAFANLCNINLDQSLAKTLTKYQTRDSHLWKERKDR